MLKNLFLRRRPQGFTLIELMIVVAVVAILAVIAYPSYQNFVRDARRADAKAALSQLASAMERYYSENLTYVGAADSNDAPTIFPTQVPLDGGTARYNLEIEAADGNSYTLEADPITPGPQADDGWLRLLSNGQRQWDRNDNDTLDGGEACWEKRC